MASRTGSFPRKENDRLLTPPLTRAPGHPAGFSGCVITTHSFVARKYIFETARQYVVNARLAIGRGRPLIKTEQRTTLGLRQRLPEDIVLAPKLQHLCLEGWPVVTALNFFKCQYSHSKNNSAPESGDSDPNSGARILRGTTRFHGLFLE